MKKDPLVFLEHILESIDRIEQYLHNVDEETFHVSGGIQDQVVRRIEIIGEATKNLPREFREQYPEVPWKDMAGMRDVIAHQYFDINYNRVWDTATELLPPLKKQIELIIQEVNK